MTELITFETLQNTRKILKGTDILTVFKNIENLEKERIWCHHGFDHSMDVARITWIMILERISGTFRNDNEDYNSETTSDVDSDKNRASDYFRRLFPEGGNAERLKDIVYTCALIHDTGREEEYLGGRDHETVSSENAERYLRITDYSREEKEMIIRIIDSHRNKDDSKSLRPSSPEDYLILLFKKADRLSRMCFDCEGRNTCKWAEEKKNPFPVY